MSAIADIPDLWERMVRAVDAVEDRLLRSTAALEAAGIPYAVIGGNAVAAWVATVDAEATRNTKDVDLLVERSRLPDVIAAMTAAGFEYANVVGVDLFLDGPAGKPGQGVHLLYFGEMVRAGDALPNPDVGEVEHGRRFRVISLEGLVRMKLTSFRRKDQVHLQDLIGQGLIDDTWPARFPVVLADRLREILADPEG